MAIEIGNSSLVQNNHGGVRDAQQKAAEVFARVPRNTAQQVEQVVDESISHPVSSDGHAGPEGQKGGVLDVSA